ncbi:MAG: hypothetical protein IJ518_03385 [Clostridia bacterium]|nr:hypothetical protein [Clostridia bacterium]
MKVYKHYVDPVKYPWFAKRAEPVVTHDQLDNRVQFAVCRSFPLDPKTNRLYGIEETIRKYTQDYDMGRCFWLHYKNFLADNVEEMLEALKAHGLYLYGGWGFVPGGIKSCDVPSSWGEFRYSKKLDETIRRIMGDHFFGYEMGEQDGRYIGAYVSREDGSAYPKTRVGQMKNFDHYHGKMATLFHDKMTILASLALIHYYARGGYATLLSCEAAQALPNPQMWYAFIRGASKQYGILPSGNVSVWNQTGYKYYGEPGLPNHGAPEKGTSLSLMRRILWNEYMYNCVFLGFENSWFDNDDSESHILSTVKPEDVYAPAGLTPIGQVQTYANKLVNELGRPGVMYAPVAFMMDAHAGWNPPAHLYSPKLYEVWGNIPYNSGDFQTHALFTMLYPRYEDAGRFVDETGFLNKTRYGEIADVLLSDAAGEILNQYRLLVMVNDTHLTAEVYDKVQKFVEAGGHLVLWAPTVLASKNREALLPYFGMEMAGGKVAVENTTAMYTGKTYPVSALTLINAVPTADATVEATVDGKPAMLTVSHGAGKVTVLLTETGLEQDASVTAAKKENEQPIAQPYTWTPFVEAYLGDLFDSYTLVKPTDEELQYIVNVKDEKTLLLQVTNNTYTARRYDIVGCAAGIAAVKPVLIEDTVQEAVGYYPACVEVDASAVVGEGAYTIAAGDVVMYEITLQDALELQAESLPAFRDRKLGAKLPMNAVSIRDFLLETPTFEQYFDTILVDAAYLERMDKEYLAEEAHWLHRYGITLSVDFTRLLNTFPDLRFDREYPEMREASFVRLNKILDKFNLYDGETVFIARNLPANSGSADMSQALVDLAEHIRAYIRPEVALCCRNRGLTFDMKSQLGPVAEMEGVSLAWDSCAGLSHRIPGPLDVDEVAKSYAFSAVLLSAPTFTVTGNPQNANIPVVGSGFEQPVKHCLEAVPTGTVYLAADYADWDAVYADYRYLFG